MFTLVLAQCGLNLVDFFADFREDAAHVGPVESEVRGMRLSGPRPGQYAGSGSTRLRHAAPSSYGHTCPVIECSLFSEGGFSAGEPACPIVPVPHEGLLRLFDRGQYSTHFSRTQ